MLGPPVAISEIKAYYTLAENAQRTSGNNGEVACPFKRHNALWEGCSPVKHFKEKHYP